MTGRGPSLEGSLDELSLPELLRLLARTGKTGVVELRGRTPGTVALVEGRLAAAASTSSPTLRQVVVGAGLADRATWEAVEGHGADLVEALVRAGVDRSELDAVLAEQVVGSVFELSLPSSDAFAFYEGETPPDAPVRLDVDEVLAEADGRVDAWRAIAATIPSTAVVVRLAPTVPGPSVTIAADEWRVLARIDGRATVADIIRALGMSAFAVCAVLHRLHGAGAVEVVPDET